MKTMKIITEGVWSGYRASQSRPCHRTVHKRKSPYEKIACIAFSDGTTMRLTHRPAGFREKVVEIHGYDRLLDAAVSQGLEGWVHVDKVEL